MNVRWLAAHLAWAARLSALTVLFVLAGHSRSEVVRVTTYRIHRATSEAPHISPYQYGQFIEYLCDLVPGMWADKLEDGGFDGVTPYAFTFLKETDFHPRLWYPWGAVNRAEVNFDERDAVQGARSLHISVADGSACTVGIAQDGISVRRNESLTFSGYLKTERRTTVDIQLVAPGKVLARAHAVVGSEWSKHTLRLRPCASASNATFAVTFRGPGSLRLDCLSLMPDDAVGGWRRDVVEAVRALRPGVIRFGGSVVDYPAYGDYDWRKTVGPVEKRTPFRSWGGLQPIGAGLEEIVQFIRSVGAEPLICVRFIGSTPEEAAAQVEYFNGSPETPMGAWRARNGHPEPYRIRFWQVGNEVRSEEYDERMARFCRAMKRVDPHIWLLSSYPTEAVIQRGAGLLDFLCPHHYGCGNLDAMHSDLNALREAIARLAPNSGLKIAVTEWNTTAGDWGPARATLWTLANALACARYHNLLHRHADIVEIANRSNLTNSFCAGIIQTNPTGLYRTPTYYAQQLYARRAGSLPLPVTTPGQQALDISATCHPKSRRIAVFVVNDTLDAEEAELDVAELGTTGTRIDVTVLGDTLQAGEPDVTNSFTFPARVIPVRSTATTDGRRIRYTFSPLSLTVLEWKAARSPQVAR